jgi:hypothetical protein
VKLDPEVLAHLPLDLTITLTVTVKELLKAFAHAEDVPEIATTSEVSRAWGFSPRKWREWASGGLIPGAVVDEGGNWRLPRMAAREQFERALGKSTTSTPHPTHLPRSHGPRKKREARP